MSSKSYQSQMEMVLGWLVPVFVILLIIMMWFSIPQPVSSAKTDQEKSQKKASSQKEKKPKATKKPKAPKKETTQKRAPASRPS